MPSQSPSPWRCGRQGFEDESFRVYQQVTLPPLHLLVAIVAALFSAHPGPLERLAIYGAGAAGLRVPVETDPDPLSRSVACCLSQLPSQRNCLRQW
jgi:hypothetical protein